MSLPSAEFGRGDRAPDFWLPNPEGKLGQFYDRFKGNGIVLFFYASNADEAGQRELRGFLDRLDTLAAADLRFVAVNRDSAESNAGVVRSCSCAFDLFSDPKGAITQGYGVAPPDRRARPTTFVIDRAQRILRVLDVGPGQAEAVLAYLQESGLAESGVGVVTEQAPVLLLPNVFDDDICNRLIRDWATINYEGEVITGSQQFGAGDDAAHIQYAIKKRRDHKPEEAFNGILRQIAGRRIAPELYKAFQFKTGFLQPFLIGCYAEQRGDYFLPHRDNVTKRTENRRFAISINLNDDYDGGCLRFREFSQRLYRPAKGGAVVFSCSLLHEATPVTGGERYVALSFVFAAGDPKPSAPLSVTRAG